MAKRQSVSSHSNLSNRYAKAKRYGRKPMLLLIALLIVLVALGLCGFQFAYATMLPDVIELSEQDATEILKNYDMQVEVQRDWSDSYEEGLVMKQEPSGGAHASPGDTVTVIISKGPQSVAMPDLSGMNKEEATSLLDQLSVSWMLSEAYSDETEAGMVISQTPPARDEVQPGEKVMLLVSKGQEPEIRTSQDVEVVKSSKKKSDTKSNSSTMDSDTTLDSDNDDDDGGTTTTTTMNRTTTRNTDSNSTTETSSSTSSGASTSGNTSTDSSGTNNDSSSTDTDDNSGSAGIDDNSGSAGIDDNSASSDTGDPALDEEWSAIN